MLPHGPLAEARGRRRKKAPSLDTKKNGIRRCRSEGRNKVQLAMSRNSMEFSSTSGRVCMKKIVPSSGARTSQRTEPS